MKEEWKKAYREGFADGYAAAKKEQIFNPYGSGTVMGTPNLGAPPVNWGTDNQPRAVAGGPSTSYAGGHVPDIPEQFYGTLSSSDY